MTEELNAKIDLLESEIEILKQKTNEVIACLEDNELSRKVSIEYLYPEEMEEDNKPAEEETTKEEPKEETKKEAEETKAK